MDYLEIHSLYHHGIKGQKWGVRRFQDENGQLTSAGRKRYDIGSFRKKAEELLSKHGSKASGEVSPEVVQYGTMVATAVLMAVGGVIASRIRTNHAKNEDEKKLKTEMYDSRSVKELKDLKKSKKKQSPDKNMKETNPDYPAEGYTENCVHCTTAMVMREKGYSVKARPSDDGHYTDRAFPAMFSNSKEVRCNKKKLESELMSLGDGAYGNLSVMWTAGGGHSIFWKNENGKVSFYDGQTGKKYDNNVLLGNYITNYTCYTQLDNCEPTPYVLGVIDNA